ncbi:MAG: CehA/McbA family metallohydrolase [Bacillota bacterium]
MRIPLGWTPPSLEPGPGQVRWDVRGRALVLGEIVRRRHVQLNLTGGRLVPGDTVELAYGGDPDGAQFQPWVTDLPARFEVEVDEAGDGRFVLDAWADLAVEPGPPAHLHVVAPSSALAGQAVSVRVAVLDAYGNLQRQTSGCAELAVEGSSLAAARADCFSVIEGLGAATVRLAGPGVHRFRVTLLELGLSARSNPCRVFGSVEPVPAGLTLGGPFWGDPHVHTVLSDGAGSADFALTYARDVALLDFSAIADHDIEHHHAWFTRQRQRLSDEEWQQLAGVLRRHRRPGRFAALRGYEWTGRPYGDRCVYFRDDDVPMRRYEPDDAPTPEQLWQGLQQSSADGALVVPHTVVSHFMGTDWAAHDADIERLVEIYSMHGASEFPGCPLEMSGAVAGRSIREALARGYRFGFCAGSDTHSSQPGNPVLDMGPYRTLRHKPGLTAVYADTLSEAALFDAMRRRRTYATTGARILVWFEVSGTPMGGELTLPRTVRPVVRAWVSATAPLAEVSVIRDGEVTAVMQPHGQQDLEFTWEDSAERTDPARYYYLRAVQTDGEMAWTSPVWVVSG